MSISRPLFRALAVASLLACVSTVSADVYELRTYTAAPGKLDALNARFRDHTIRLFKKHGIDSLGYWVPTDAEKSKNTLIYVIKHKSREAAAASWKSFLADPEWQEAAKNSGVGKLMSRPESVYMDAAAYSPNWMGGKRDGKAVFELRTYRTNEGKLSNLDARFRDHTIRIFEKHGMKSVAYWHPMDAPDSKDTLIYIIRHDSEEAAAGNWKSFGTDPAWKKVAKESQVDGRILRERPESVYMAATPYSGIQ